MNRTVVYIQQESKIVESYGMIEKQTEENRIEAKEVTNHDRMEWNGKECERKA